MKKHTSKLKVYMNIEFMISRSYYSNSTVHILFILNFNPTYSILQVKCLRSYKKKEMSAVYAHLCTEQRPKFRSVTQTRHCNALKNFCNVLIYKPRLTVTCTSVNKPE